ncbi:DUF481 domain-containing protein [Ideonella paludis]|uniref:DUF481 domain-containing protein n=1 Tax=Ideonella paludis TaxID=1233411 RepID=A0ABS5DVV2_9BURK|nr:DUF481 domain-containing protein [Ideonella paludis]MBQ0935250.1 DUF481 domain-containing protein [Ideonella paludis]
MTSIRFLSAVAVASAALFGASAVSAQAVNDGQWHGSLSAGGAFASGNTSSRVLTAGADATRATAADKISLYANGNYARANGVTTANLGRLGGRYDYNLSDALFAFGGGEYETNKAGGLKSRYGVNAGLGYRWVRSKDAQVDVFGGVGYSDSSYTNNTSADGAELILGEEGSYKLSASTTIKQRLVFYPGLGDLGNRATFDAGVATAISGGWTLNTGLAWRYNSEPAAGLKKTDTLLTVGFGYKY